MMSYLAYALKDESPPGTTCTYSLDVKKGRYWLNDKSAANAGADVFQIKYGNNPIAAHPKIMLLLHDIIKMGRNPIMNIGPLHQTTASSFDHSTSRPTWYRILRLDYHTTRISQPSSKYHNLSSGWTFSWLAYVPSASLIWERLLTRLLTCYQYLLLLPMGCLQNLWKLAPFTTYCSFSHVYCPLTWWMNRLDSFYNDV